MIVARAVLRHRHHVNRAVRAAACDRSPASRSRRFPDSPARNRDRPRWSRRPSGLRSARWWCRNRRRKHRPSRARWERSADCVCRCPELRRSRRRAARRRRRRPRNRSRVCRTSPKSRCWWSEWFPSGSARCAQCRCGRSGHRWSRCAAFTVRVAALLVAVSYRVAHHDAELRSIVGGRGRGCRVARRCRAA